MNDERELTQEELEAQEGAALPPRELMSVIDITGDGGPIYSLPVEPVDEV